MNHEKTLENLFLWAQAPTQTCAGQAVIVASAFEELATEASTYPDVTKTRTEIKAILTAQALRFSACGANNSGKWGVIRASKKTGWKYIIDLITIGSKEVPAPVNNS